MPFSRPEPQEFAFSAARFPPWRLPHPLKELPRPPHLPGRTMASKGEHVTKPQGYRQATTEQLCCFFVLCLPYYQGLLFAGMSGMVSFLLLTYLLMFVVVRSPAICHTVTALLKALPPSWVAPILDRRAHWASVPLYVVASGPSLAPSFQRPPPLFS
jgi:hypothetical protein